MRLDFCLPAKNEEKLLKTNVELLKNFLIEKNWPFTWQIVILLNGCSDSSLSLATDLAAESQEKIIFYNFIDSGKGLTLRNYFKMSPADILVFMDIDLAVSLDNIPELLRPLLENKNDLVFGSRLLPDSRTVRSWWREASSRFYNKLSRIMLNHRFRDLQCGFKALKKEVFERVEPFLQDKNWFFDTELIIFAAYLDYRLLEIPVDWQENRYAQRTSRIKVFKDAVAFLKNLFILKKRLASIKKHPDNV
jgi:glycosyltransferase involved in cell wall biosynthesis